MYGSASTWVFNAARKVALTLLPDRPILGPYVVSHADLPSLDDDTHPVIVKSHETDDAAAAELSRLAQAIWISIRDPRDCVTSLLRYHGLSFAAALAWVEKSAHFCARFTDDPRAILLRYEAGFVDDPATLDQMAASLGGVLPAVDRDRIFAETRRAAVDAFIAQLETLPTVVRPKPNALVDLVTQWHEHHANRTGEIGGWRDVLSPPEAAEVEQRMKDWMQAFHYHREIGRGP
jgi:hypothetical protein